MAQIRDYYRFPQGNKMYSITNAIAMKKFRDEFLDFRLQLKKQCIVNILMKN